MESKSIYKRTFLLLFLSFVTVSLLPILRILGSIPAAEKIIEKFIENGPGIIIAMQAFALYALPHTVNTIIICAQLRLARDNKNLYFAPILSLMFAASSFGMIHATSSSIPGIILSYALTILFYAVVIVLEIFGKKLHIGDTSKKIIFLLFSAFNFFIGSALVVYVIERGVADGFGIGWALCVLFCYPLYFVFAGIYTGLQDKAVFSYFPIVSVVLFLANSAIVARVLDNIGAEIIVIALVYFSISYFCLGITYLIKKAVILHKN